MVKNTLTDLNNYLFEQLERLNDDELTDEQLERELKATKSYKMASWHSGQCSIWMNMDTTSKGTAFLPCSA